MCRESISLTCPSSVWINLSRVIHDANGRRGTCMALPSQLPVSLSITFAARLMLGDKRLCVDSVAIDFGRLCLDILQVSYRPD